ncbi:MAG: polar amino acid transport system substrate-binding protein [Alphaproteobacteria bacterium]|jgi:polar amino acid transport system substrate-binding protein
MLPQLLANSGIENVNVKLEYVSFARALSELENRKNTIALHFAKSPDREKKFKWLGPYYEIKLGLVGLSRHSKAYPNIKSIKDNYIAVVRGTLVEDILLDRGFPKNNMLLISDPVSGLKMLNAGRIDMLAHIPSVLRYLAKNELEMNESTLEEKFTLQTGHFYFALSQDFDDEFVLKLQTVLDEMLDNYDFARLYTKSNLNNKSRS